MDRHTANQLGDLLINHLKGKLEQGTISGSEVATLSNLLRASGWRLDMDSNGDDLARILSELGPADDVPADSADASPWSL